MSLMATLRHGLVQPLALDRWPGTATAGLVLLATVLLAGCAVAAPEPDGSPDGAPSPSAAEPSTPSTPDPSRAGVPGESPPDSPAARRPPLVVPAAVAARPELPWCGHEVVDRTPQGDFYDAKVRECFLAAYGIGEPAEFVSDGLTVEGGRVRTIFRSIAAGDVEVYYDNTADHLSSQDWTFATCTALRPFGADPSGVPAFIPDRCTEPQVVVGTVPETDPTPADLRLVESLVAFAQSPDAETLAAHPARRGGGARPGR